MEFLNSTPDDLETIFGLYDAAIAHQKQVSEQHWLPFDRQMVRAEIAEGRQWKIVVDGQVACVFMAAYQDPAIWGERDRDPSVYLHRIVTNPDFRGRHFVAAIADWAAEHGRVLGKKYVRLDTWADNPKLKEVYTRSGFRFLGIGPPADPAALPSHYSTITLSFFERAID